MTTHARIVVIGGRMPAIARIDRALAQTSTDLRVQILLQDHQAVFVSDPVHDPENERLKG